MSTINVNLAKCDCGGLSSSGKPFWSSGEHHSMCPWKPIPVPCPIPTKVEFKVIPGECDCRWRPSGGSHHTRCPARPISVTCSISGKTWEESEVTEVDVREKEIYPETYEPMLATCRARWALVKALVLGHTDLSALLTGPKAAELFAQRDRVFAALTKAHRAEDALIDALGDYEEAMRGEPCGIYGLKRESHGALERYVNHLVEQVETI